MIITKEILIKTHSRLKTYYTELGYNTSNDFYIWHFL